MNFIPPKNPNYVLCISYILNGVVTRYLLWDAVGSNLNETIPPYNGQPILKNFRLEIWNTNQGAASQTTPITFQTSVLGKIDYRFGTDFVLRNPDPVVTNFADNTVINLIPSGLVFPPIGTGPVSNATMVLIQGFVIGDNYTLTAGNAQFLYQQEPLPTPGIVIPPGNFTAGATSLWIGSTDPTVVGQVITAFVPSPTPVFNLPLTFPSNSTSLTN